MANRQVWSKSHHHEDMMHAAAWVGAILSAIIIVSVAVYWLSSLA